MRLEAFIARRYMLPGRQRPMVSAVSLVTVSGVAIGVFSLVVVLAVLRGYYARMAEEMAGFLPHLTVFRVPVQSAAPLTTATVELVRSVPGVKGAMPRVWRSALVRVPGGRNRGKVVGIFGLDPKEGPKVLPGLFRQTGAVVPEPGQMILGPDVCRSLGVTSGSRLLASFYPEFKGRGSPGAPVSRPFRFAGSWQENQSFDRMAFMNLGDQLELFGVAERGLPGIQVAIDDLGSLDVVKKALQERLGSGICVLTWREMSPSFTEMLGVTMRTMFVILFLLVVVAALNIVGTLVMVVMEKTREIGGLKAMGASERQIARIFLLHGFSVGFVGALCGAVAGLFVCYLLKYHVSLHWLARFAGEERFPVCVEPLLTFLIGVSAVLVAAAASLYPAWKVARLDPVEALKHE